MSFSDSVLFLRAVPRSDEVQMQRDTERTFRRLRISLLAERLGGIMSLMLMRTLSVAGAALAFLALSAPAPQDSHTTVPLDRRIDEFVRDEMRRQRIPGVAVAVVNKGTVTARGYGYANLEHMVAVTDETIFQSGSLGKMFTAAAIMLQVEDRKLALADPITTFYPDAPPPWSAITVRHLLTHK